VGVPVLVGVAVRVIVFVAVNVGVGVLVIVIVGVGVLKDEQISFNRHIIMSSFIPLYEVPATTILFDASITSDEPVLLNPYGPLRSTLPDGEKV
jgi:hypothetical protein